MRLAVFDVARRIGLKRAVAVAAFGLVAAAAINAPAASAAPLNGCYKLGGKVICDPVVVQPWKPRPDPCLSCPIGVLDPSKLVTNPAVNPANVVLPVLGK